MDKCKANWFELKNPEHGRDHSSLILTESMEIFYYRRQDGRYHLMMEFESSTYPDKFNYRQYIGDVSKDEFDNNFNCL
jgi:hypothetical protein